MKNNRLWLYVGPRCRPSWFDCRRPDRRYQMGKHCQFPDLDAHEISFIRASVIWKLVYDYRGEGPEKIGFLNAIVEFFDATPQAQITMPFWNALFLKIIVIWIQTGFAMGVLSAALRGISEETI